MVENRSYVVIIAVCEWVCVCARYADRAFQREMYCKMCACVKIIAEGFSVRELQLFPGTGSFLRIKLMIARTYLLV